MSFTIPLRRWPFPRPCGLPWANAGWVRLTSQHTPLIDFSVPPESFSADPSHAHRARRLYKAGSSHGLRFPTAHSSEKDPLTAGRAKTRYVPPSGFGYPLDGFRPFCAWSGLFRPDSAPGILPFGAFPAHKVATAFLRPPNLRAVNPTRSSSGQAAKPVRRASTSRLRPSRASLAASGGLARGTLDAPLGFCPSKVLPPAALLGLPPEAPLTRLACIARRLHTARTSGCRSATGWPDYSPR